MTLLARFENKDSYFLMFLFIKTIFESTILDKGMFADKIKLFVESLIRFLGCADAHHSLGASASKFVFTQLESLFGSKSKTFQLRSK